jgi:cob(I)alamin adenosyltransferase
LVEVPAGTLEIRPGSMLNGVNLRKRFTDRIEELGTTLKKLKETLYRIGMELYNVADTYDHTNDLNKDDLDRLDNLVDEISKAFPGVKDMIPQV